MSDHVEEEYRNTKHGGPEEASFPLLSFLGSGEGLDLCSIVVAGQNDIETRLFYPFDDVSRTDH